MKNLNYNQIKIFMNLKIIGKEDKNKKYIPIFFNLKKFLQFSEITGYNHGFEPQLLVYSIVYDTMYLKYSSAIK